MCNRMEKLHDFLCMNSVKKLHFLQSVLKEFKTESLSFPFKQLNQKSQKLRECHYSADMFAFYRELHGRFS